ncbi:hypothetical protein BD289DRAFT_482714 [Coniella lustricola]|uniref:Uncharacterized protein n=1 Tax=Coniella lustricola TaxID=2025994 RepID=A0A2T3A804_9PEZI|nr:hypothetical protein BD289DRAFT_482714 [Coniella lustricola]
MGKGRMDEAAAERIKKARGEKDDFARRAALAAKTNKETSGQAQGGGQSGGSSGKQESGGSKK